MLWLAELKPDSSRLEPVTALPGTPGLFPASRFSLYSCQSVSIWQEEIQQCPSRLCMGPSPTRHAAFALPHRRHRIVPSRIYRLEGLVLGRPCRASISKTIQYHSLMFDHWYPHRSVRISTLSQGEPSKRLCGLAKDAVHFRVLRAGALEAADRVRGCDRGTAWAADLLLEIIELLVGEAIVRFELLADHAWYPNARVSLSQIAY